MKQTHVYVLDLTRMGGSGEFSCPECGNAISPDDCNEEAYSVLEAKVNGDCLDALVICCGKCGSQIHLTGFSLLQKLPDTDTKKSENKEEESTSFYCAHI